MPKLPYTMEALAPLMSKETLDFHYGKHLQAYVNNLNALIAGTSFENMELEEIIKKAEGGTFNNAAQTWNHTFFFNQLTPKEVKIPEKLEKALNKTFGSVQIFKEEFTQAAATFFGSGWVWLVSDEKENLSITSTPNAGNPLTQNLKPLLVIDVWEHAYYIDYRNNRKAYIDSFWKLINWEKVADLL